MNRSKLKPNDIHRNLYTRNGNMLQLNIEEAIINIPRLSRSDHTVQINETQIQLKECRAKMPKKYASLQNIHDFEKDLERSKISKIMEVPSTQQNSGALEKRNGCNSW